ncbi:helix-turn-helix domain-containing protein [Paracoccus jeotgali]|uniref:HTH araC/xylS-type domain-containing protein n=1 Tax=Paracoccus jeotgali TaxID=2065379 RepID=A0A2K9MDW8_9RHOB|nr:helix-turn-helix domain-containing protein [Paracoccus jeotgali]AUM73847.1 hypothetical protein CYR75_05695 [Paracoccus jeotgali]
MIGLRRTLQRRLADVGVKLSDLVDVTRRDIALARLLTGVGSLKALALDLGYSDQAHFTRSFKRWTGSAPTAYGKFNSDPEQRGANSGD